MTEHRGEPRWSVTLYKEIDATDILPPAELREEAPKMAPKAAKWLSWVIAAACGASAAAVASRVVGGEARGLDRSIYAKRSAEGRKSMVGGRGGTSARAEAAVEAGLRWLAQAREKDGSWDSKSWGARTSYVVAGTGLALMAFQGAGYTHTKGPYRVAVAGGLAWLRAHQKPDGRFPYSTFYEQGIATIAVCEAYSLTGDKGVGRVARRAVEFILRTQPDHGGFRYGGAVPRNEGDMSVTGWQILAIVSGYCAGFPIPEANIERCRRFLTSIQRDHGTSAYVMASQAGGSSGVSAFGMLCRMFVDEHGFRHHIRQTADYLLSKAREAGRRAPGGATTLAITDLYYIHHASLAMFQFGGEYWAQWNAAFRDPLVEAQVREERDAAGRYVRGSWDPANHRWARHAGGRVYATAMAVLCLETYYRYRGVNGKKLRPPAEF